MTTAINWRFAVPEGMSAARWRWVKFWSPRKEKFLLYYPNLEPAGSQVLRVCDRTGYDGAILTWKTCHECRRGVILKISITADWQRQGLGTGMVLRAMQDVPDYQWTTTGQSPEAQQFFPVLRQMTGAAFTARAPSCEHIRASRRGLPRPLLERRLPSA